MIDKSLPDELLKLLARFVLFLFIMRFLFVDFIQFVFHDEPLLEGREIVRPLDDFTGGPRPVAPRLPCPGAADSPGRLSRAEAAGR